MGPLPFLIRRARTEDASAIAVLLGQLGYPTSDDDARGRLVRIQREEGSRLLVAERDGVVAGLVGLHLLTFLERDGRWCRITALVVGEEARRAGVGRALVEAVEEVARAERCLCVEVSSGVHRADAHAFYERLGYEERRRRFQKWF